MKIHGSIFWCPYIAVSWGQIVNSTFPEPQWTIGFGFRKWWACSYFELVGPMFPCTPGFYRSIGPFFIERAPGPLPRSCWDRNQSPGSKGESYD